MAYAKRTCKHTDVKVECSACLAKLIAGVNKRKRLPKGFGLWTNSMIVGWLKQNQQSVA